MPFYTVKIIVYSTHLPHKDVWPLTVFPTPPWVQFITESSFSSVLQTFTILCPDAPILCLHGLSSSVFRSLATVWSLRDHCSKSFQDVKLTETRSESLWGQDDFCNAEILLAFFFFFTILNHSNPRDRTFQKQHGVCGCNRLYQKQIWKLS